MTNEPSRPDLWFIPTSITMLGLGLGVTGAMLFPSSLGIALLLLSLVLDVFDGRIARRLQATSEIGAALDLISDVVIASVLAYATLGRTWAGLVILGVTCLGAASWAKLAPRPLSGRTALTAFVVLHVVATNSCAI